MTTKPPPAELIKLGDNIFVINNFLSPDECAEHIRFGEKQGFQPADVTTAGGREHLTHIRNNERVDLQSTQMADQWWQKLKDLPLPEFEGSYAIGLSPYFRFYKYCPGQKFNMHRDGRQQVGEHQTLFTLLVYLNESCDGGNTRFRQHDLTVSPQTGKALLFEHHLWHRGALLNYGHKYVLRTDVVYSNG